jgi:hypothetical protein
MAVLVIMDARSMMAGHARWARRIVMVARRPLCASRLLVRTLALWWSSRIVPADVIAVRDDIGASTIARR